MEFVTKIMRTIGALTVQAVKNDLQAVTVTGKSAKKVRFEVTSPSKTVDRLIIYGPAYIETGRGPRKSTEESGFLDNLEEWVAHRFGGLDKKKQERLAKFFRWKINKEGDKTFKAGGRHIYDQTLFKATDEIKRQVVKEFRINFSNFVKNAAHGIDNS